MGLCASASSSAATATTTAGEDMADADADYKKQLDKIDDARDNNLLSTWTFPVSQALGHGYLVLPAEAKRDAPVTTLDGNFSRVMVRGQDQARVLRMRTFRRKHLLRGGMHSAASRIAPFVAGIEAMHRLRPCRFVLPLEHAFYDKNNCILVMGMYETTLSSLLARGLVLDENAVMSIVVSLALALRHMHAVMPPVLAGSDNLVAAHVLVNTQGHAYLSLLPTAVTQVGVVEDAQQQEQQQHIRDEKAKVATSEEEEEKEEEEIDEATLPLAASGISTGSKASESPGAKYRVQTKQSEVRSEQDPADIAEENRLKARDWLLLGRLMASLCGVVGGSVDTELLQAIVASTTLAAHTKQTLAGLLEAEDEKRWKYDNVRSSLPGVDFPWTLFEDSKETARPPPFASQEVLGQHVAAIMAKHAEVSAKFEQDTLEATEVEAKAEAENKETRPEAESKSEVEEPAPIDSDDEYDLDSIASEDSLAMLDEDELLPWEVTEVLAKWDFRSTVASLHQLSNFTNSKTMASFAAYDAQFQGGNKQSKKQQQQQKKKKKTGTKGGVAGGEGGALRADLSGIGRILEDDITRQEKAYSEVCTVESHQTKNKEEEEEEE